MNGLKRTKVVLGREGAETDRSLAAEEYSLSHSKGLEGFKAREGYSRLLDRLDKWKGTVKDLWEFW